MVFRKVFELIFPPLEKLFNTGKLVLCADCRMRVSYPVSCVWTADYFEDIHLHSIKQSHCFVFNAAKSSFGYGNLLSGQLRDYQLYLQRMILATQGDSTARQEESHHLEDPVAESSEGGFSNIKYISLMNIIVPDILQTVYLGMLKHLINCVMSFLEQHSRIDKFNQLWPVMPPYPVFAWLNMPQSQLTRWCDKEMKALRRVTVPVFVATLLNPSLNQKIPLTEALLYVNNVVYFYHMV